MIGGDPVLDFINTVSDWTTTSPREDLPSFEVALRFGVESGLLTKREAARLDNTGSELARLHTLRALLHRLFTGQAAEDDLDALSRAYAEASRHGRLRKTKETVLFTFTVERSGAALLRHRLVHRAVELLTDDTRRARVKSCPSCAWVFLDVSKNGSRRWCSMEMCGGSAKAAAYYQRRKSES